MAPHRRSNGASLFRMLFGLIALGLMGLIYWSNTLVEVEVKELRREMQRLQGDLTTLRVAAPSVSPTSLRPHIRNELPNLLQEDPYLTETLPKLLPEGFQPNGTLRTAFGSRPQDFHPHSPWHDVRIIYELCLGMLARHHVGDYHQYRPDLAIKVEEREVSGGGGRTEYWVHLREGATWEPLHPAHFPKTVQLAPYFLERHPVTAYDFQFGYQAVMNPHVQESLATSLRPYYADIEEFRVVDDLTFVVRWRAVPLEQPDGSTELRAKESVLRMTLNMLPLPCWVYQRFSDGTKVLEGDDYHSNSVWAQNFSQHWAKNVLVCCGPWLFDGLSDTEIRLKRNPYHHEPRDALTKQRVVYFKTGPEAMWQDFKAGKIDVFNSSVAPQKLQELEDFTDSAIYREQTHAIKRVDYLSRSFRYIGWNQQRPIFSSKKVRQALTMAIDRDRLIQQCLNTMGCSISGPFFPEDESYATVVDPWPYDPVAAEQLLAEEGWVDLDGDGILDRESEEGQREPLRFKLLYFVHSPTTRLLADGIATSLKEIGVECRPVGMDVADLGASMEAKDFDAMIMGWTLGTPPPECRQLWHSEGAKKKGSSNLISFANEEADSIIEALDYEQEWPRRKTLYHRLHALLHEEAPYTFLYSPKVALLYRDNLNNVFVPAQRPDLIPGATVTEPILDLCWLSENNK